MLKNLIFIILDDISLEKIDFIIKILIKSIKNINYLIINLNL